MFGQMDSREASRSVHRSVASRRGRAGRRRRDVQLALHGQPDQGPGGLSLRLGPRRQGHGRRHGQARHHRREPGLEPLRQGHPQGVGRRAAARRITWASPTTGASSGPAASTTATSSMLRRRHRPGAAQARADHRPTLATKTGYVGPHTFYAMPGRMLVAGPVQHQGRAAASPAWRSTATRARWSRPIRCRPPTAATATATTSRSIRRRTSC